MVSKLFAIICLTTVVVSARQNPCVKQSMDYYRCEKNIQKDDSLTTLCDKIDAILARCFDVYQECADNEVIERSKEEYIMELVDTPIAEPAWQNLKKCKLIQERLATSKCDYQTVLINKYHHKECVEENKKEIFKPLMSSDDLQTAVCDSFNRVALGECAQYHWLCYDKGENNKEEKVYVEGWLKYWDTQLKGYQPVSIKKCHNYVAKTTGTVRMFRGNGK